MLTVSNYHYIRPDFTSKFPSIFGMTPSAFKNQLVLLKNKNEFISAVDLITNLDTILASKTNYFLVTFDDGLKEQYDYALPILEELQIPAILFANSRNYEDKKVSTVHKVHLLRSILSTEEIRIALANQSNSIQLQDSDFLKAQSIYVYDDQESAALKYLLNYKLDFKIQEEIISELFDEHFDENSVLSELYMNEEEIINLSKRGYLGSHTHSHYPLGLLERESIKFELQNSKLYFENVTNSKIEMVAYPYGTPEASTEEVAFFAKDLGYKLGFTTTRGINTKESDKLLLNRFDCNDLPGGKNFKAK